MQQWLRLGIALVLVFIVVVSGAVWVVHAQEPLELEPIVDIPWSRR